MNIKKELEKEYADYEANNEDGYGNACVLAGESVMALLDEGKTPEEAERGLHGHGLTGFMAGAAIQGVCHFHERGEEMRVWWNEKHGVSKDKKGVVNPALVTINI